MDKFIFLCTSILSRSKCSFDIYSACFEPFTPMLNIFMQDSVENQLLKVYSMLCMFARSVFSLNVKGMQARKKTFKDQYT